MDGKWIFLVLTGPTTIFGLTKCKMAASGSFEEYIARFRNLKIDILTFGGKEYVSIILNNLCPTVMNHCLDSNKKSMNNSPL